MSLPYIYTMGNPLFNSLLFHSALLLFKMAFVMFITVYYRFTPNVSYYPENGKARREKARENKAKELNQKSKDQNNNILVDEDPDIGRAKAVFESDMECVFPFILVALMYIAIEPLPKTCLMCFRIFTIGRYAHTFFYLVEIPEPIIILAYVPHGVILYMAYQISLAANGYF